MPSRQSASGVWARILLRNSGLYQLTYNTKDFFYELGVVTRRTGDGFPLISDYALSEMGAGFLPIVRQLEDWGLAWAIRVPICPNPMTEMCFSFFVSM